MTYGAQIKALEVKEAEARHARGRGVAWRDAAC